MVATLLAAVPGTALADLTDLPDETWGVVGLAESQTTSTPAEVMAIAQIGNTIYVGGQFLEVVRKRNEPHHAQPFLAAFDATSGEWIDWWRPTFNGPVFALEASPDGSRLYVGGEFTSVNGVGDTEGLVALDPATGSVINEWITQIEGAPGVSAPGVVRTIRAIGNWVYVGGSFNYITGPARSSRTRTYKVARLAATDGTPDTSWRPVVQDGSVWGLDVDNSRGRVYLTGFFQSIDNVADTGNFATVNTTNGDPITGLERFPILTTSQQHQLDVLVDGDSVWVAGTQHVLHKLNASDLSIDRRFFTGFAPGFHIGGDFQEIGILGDKIFATCHCWGVIRELPDSVQTLTEAQAEPVDGEVQGIIAFDRTTGDWVESFLPDILGQIGGWAVHGGGDGCLWVGGDLNRRSVGDLWRNGVVRFCDEAGQGPPVGPSLTEPPDTSETNAPSRPLNPAVNPAAGDDVVFSWNSSSDDTAVVTYIVYRDGVEERSTRRTSMQLAPGGALSVQAVDPFGNTSTFSNPIATTAVLPDVLGYWPLDSGAIDMSGNGNSGVVSGALNTPGRVIDAQQLGTGDGITVSANEDLRIGAADSDFTISTWLYLETGPTGTARVNLAANGMATLGTAATSNRIRATVDTSAGTQSFLSTTALAVGEWTHVSLVRSGAVARLYIDGASETTATLDGTTSAGSGALTMSGATARLDEVIIHGGALTAGQVADLANPATPDSLWAYYPMEGNALDASGNGFHGVLTGTTTQAGVNGQALHFDGSNSDEIQILNDPALHPGEGDGDFTVSFWINLQQDFTGAWRTIAHKGTNSSERTFAIWMRPYDNRIYFRISSDEAWSIGDNSHHEMVVGDWTHVTYVKRGNKLGLYINGEPDASATIPGNVVSNDGTIYIGDSPWFSGTAMVMDDFRIYSHGMTEAEVLALAGATPAPQPPPPPAPPTAAIKRPASGAKVSGLVKIAVEGTSAIDRDGNLDVEVRADGAWHNATWNAASGKYTYTWDTAAAPIGDVTVRGRVTDSNGATTNATNVVVEVVPKRVSYPGLVKKHGAVAYWRLNDGGIVARDAIDQTHRAFFKGPTTRTAPLLPEGGRSATFDGQDDIIKVRNHDDINTAGPYQARTIELWFESNRSQKRQVLWEEGGTKAGISIYLRGGRIHAGAWDRTAGGWDADVFVSAPYQVGEAYHVVLVIRPSTGRLRLHVNGEVADSAGGVGEIKSHVGKVGVGARNYSARFADRALAGGLGNYLDGVIDEIAVYNSALTVGQVAAHYAAAND